MSEGLPALLKMLVPSMPTAGTSGNIWSQIEQARTANLQQQQLKNQPSYQNDPSKSGGGGGSGGQTTMSTTPSTSNPQDLSSMMEAIRKRFPSFQANTGGALSPGSITDLGATGSGNPGDLNQAMQAVTAWLGQGNGQAPQGGGSQPSSQAPGGGTPPGFNIEEFINGLNKTGTGFTLQPPF